MKENNYVLHTKNGVEFVTESQAISNALEQEKKRDFSALCVPGL